jgi:DNA-binding MarR family transcriptional regulator
MGERTINNLGYALHHLALVLDRQSDLLLQERLDIGFSQFKILMALKWHSGVQQKQIAAKLGQTEASVSRQIRLLQDVGLIRAQKSEDNKRERITTLTPKGEQLIDKALNALDSYHAAVFNRLDAAQQAELKHLLAIMHEEACRSDRPGGCNYHK